MSSDPYCTAGLTCVWLTKGSFDDALREFQIACSGVSSTGLQPNMRLPAEPSSSGNEHCVRKEADDVLHSTCKVDVCHTATGHKTEGSSSLGSTGISARCYFENDRKS